MSIFTGVGVAMITPFRDGKVNFEALGEIIEYLIAGKADALCACGTTGEPSTMTAEERDAVIAYTIQRVAGRVPVIAGCGGNNTAEVVRAAERAQRAGADALLIVTPYYNKCTQKGLIAHYSAVDAAVDIPVIVYNVPGRTGVNLLPKTALALSELKHIVAIKEASGNIDQLQELCRLVAGKMDVYLGEDALTAVGLYLGAIGVISVAANAVPAEMHAIIEAMARGDNRAAVAKQYELAELIDALFCEVNPIPVKHAMNVLGFQSGEPRLPLTPMEPQNALRLEAALAPFRSRLGR